MFPRSEQALPNLLLEGQVYPSTAECGSMFNLKGISGGKATPEDVRTREATGCKVIPEDVARRELVMQNSPIKIMTDRCLHTSNLQLTNWRGQEINDTTQVFDPAVDENKNYFFAYPAG